MKVLIAGNKIDKLPMLVEGETLHIIAQKDSMVPISLMECAGAVRIHTLEKTTNTVEAAMLIGYLVAKEDADAVTVYGADTVTKAFANTYIAGAKCSIASTDPKAKTPRKPRAKTEDALEERKQSRATSDNKNKILLSLGFPEELHQSIISAVEDSSDAIIGLPMQLRMAFAKAGIKENAETVAAAIEPYYTKLKK